MVFTLNILQKIIKAVGVQVKAQSGATKSSRVLYIKRSVNFDY